MRVPHVQGVVWAIPRDRLVRAPRRPRVGLRPVVHHTGIARLATVRVPLHYRPRRSTVDRIPISNACARIQSNPEFCRGCARQEPLIR